MLDSGRGVTILGLQLAVQVLCEPPIARETANALMATVAIDRTTISPAATVSAIVPAFGYLAAMFLIAGLTYLIVARETKGQTLEDLDRQLA